MKKQLLAWRTSAVLVGVVTVLAGVAALAPAASVAKSATKCANKRVKIPTESTPPSISIPVKAITTEGGVSCATAYKVIVGALDGHPVAGYKTRTASFEAPEGLVPEIAVKGSKKIKFAVQGG